MTFHISNPSSRQGGSKDLRVIVKLFRLTVASGRDLTRAVAPGDKTFRLIYCRFGN